MQQLFPTPAGREIADVAASVGDERRDHDDGRPWVFANMVTSVDGAATVDGRSAGMGGPGDRLVFGALRAEADVIVVGARTVRDEGYRLPRQPEGPAADRRRDRGQAPRPRLCIVTRSNHIEGQPPLLEELPTGGAPAAPWQRPILATVETVEGVEASRHRDEPWDRITTGATSVDLHALITELGARGMRRVLCEGGPSLLAQLATDDLVDEWNFTIAPRVAGSDSIRPVHSATPLGVGLRLERLFLEDDSTMFARYLTVRSAR